jgi:hypothetical protein
MTKGSGLTEEQEALLDAIVEHGSVKKAALTLGISYSAAKQRLYRVRHRYWKTEEWLEEIEKLDINKILEKIPSCQNCSFLTDEGTCENSDDVIDLDGCDSPCVFWRQGRLKKPIVFQKE